MLGFGLESHLDSNPTLESTNPYLFSVEKALVDLARLLQLHNLLRRLQVGQVHVRDHVRQPTPLLHAKRRGLRAQEGSINSTA